MAGNFLKYAGPLSPNELPVDAHELIALGAPRPIFVSRGSQQMEGGWVDDKGQFMAEVAGGPVYKLLGKKGLGTTDIPPIGASLVAGDWPSAKTMAATPTARMGPPSVNSPRYMSGN